MKETNYSVLMSVYHKEQPLFLKQSIDSMLSQTVKPGDFVIVCDGPLTEELEQVISGYVQSHGELFQIVRLKENVGLGKALNAGLKRCRFELVARMDADDISLPDRIERQLAVFSARDVDIVSGSLTEFDEVHPEGGAMRCLPEEQDEILKFARRRNPFNHPCTMYKKTSVIEAGGYKHFEGFEDYYLWVRMLRKGMCGYNIPEVLLKMRVDGMHERRGGKTYASSIVKFRLYLFKSGFCSLIDFLYVVAGHVAVSILPNGIRKLFYDKVLRKK